MGGVVVVVVVAFFDVRYTLRQAIFQEWLDGRLARGMRTSRCAWPPPIAGGSSPPFWVVFLRREGKFRKISIKRDSPLGNLHFFCRCLLESYDKVIPTSHDFILGVVLSARGVCVFGWRPPGGSTVTSCQNLQTGAHPGWLAAEPSWDMLIYSNRVHSVGYVAWRESVLNLETNGERSWRCSRSLRGS